MKDYKGEGLFRIVSGAYLKVSFWRRIFPLILFLVIFLSRMPGVLSPSAQKYFDIDELNISQSTVCLFAGQTPVNLQWPGGPLYASLFFTYALDLSLKYSQLFLELVQQHFDKVIVIISNYIAEFFFEPQRQLMLGRLLVAFLSSFAPLAIFWMLKRNFLAALFSACVYASMPLFVYHSYMLLPDAVSVMCWSFSLLYIFSEDQFSRKKSIILAGVWLGIALATKGIYIPVIPVVACMLFPIFTKEPGSDKFKKYILNLVLFLGVLFLCFALSVPFIVTAPLNLAKSYLGNIAVYFKLPHKANPLFFLTNTIFVYPLGWIMLFFCINGIIGSFSILGRQRAFWMIVVLGVFLASLIGIGSFEKRHALPISVLIAVYCGLGIQFILGYAKAGLIKKLTFILAVFFVLSQAMVSAKELQQRMSHEAADRAVAWLNIHAAQGESMAIPFEAKAYFLLSPDLIAVNRALTSLSSREVFEERIEFVFESAGKKFKDIDLKDNPLVDSVFGENERQDIFSFRTMRWYLMRRSLPRTTYDIWWYQDIPNPKYLIPYVLSMQEILAKFKEGKISFLVSRAQIPELFSYQVLKVCDGQARQYLIYQRNRE